MGKKGELQYSANSSESQRINGGKDKYLDGNLDSFDDDLDTRQFLLEKQILAKLSRRASLIKMRVLKGDITVITARHELSEIKSEANNSGINTAFSNVLETDIKEIEAIIENNSENSF